MWSRARATTRSAALTSIDNQQRSILHGGKRTTRQGLAGARSALPADLQSAFAATLRRRPSARREDGPRNRGTLFRLLKESDRRRNSGAAPAARRRIGIARAHRRHVPRRENQCHGET